MSSYKSVKNIFTCVVDVVDTDQHCLDYWWPVQRLAEHSGVLSARLGEERERERERPTLCQTCCYQSSYRLRIQ